MSTPKLTIDSTFLASQHPFMTQPTRVGRLRITCYAGADSVGRRYWQCLCDCGIVKNIAERHLKSQKTQSCRCLAKELMSRRQTSHGESMTTGNTVEYRAYASAKARCNNANSSDYPRYGGRGIEFRFTSYAAFLDTVGRRPSPQHSLDRLDVNGHYEIGNVRWATKREQAQNKRTNHMVAVHGETMCFQEASRRWGVCDGTARNRIHRTGWCETCAFTIAPKTGTCVHKT